jgi:hypothetical protein
MIRRGIDMVKKKDKSIISPKVDKLVVRVVEDEDDDMLEETIEVILQEEPPTE